MSEPSPLDVRLSEQFDRTTEFINTEVLFLRLIVGGFRQTVIEAGQTPGDIEPGEMSGPADWVVTRGVARTDELISISLWAVFEVFVEDVFAAICELRPPDPDKLPNVALPVASFLAMEEDDRWRWLWDEALRTRKPKRKYAVDKYDDLLGDIGIEVDVAALPPLIAPEANQDGATVRANLRELQAVRNVLLHRRGRVDDQLASLDSQVFPLGQTVTLPDDKTLQYGLAVLHYCAALTAAAGDDLLTT